jgi:16S rRNA processing protein RimM
VPATDGPAAGAVGDLIIVGEVTRPHGVRGAVRVLPVTDFPDRLLRRRHVVLVHAGRARSMRVEQAAAAGQFVVLKLAGVDTPEAAKDLRGAEVCVPHTEVPPPPPGQFYVFQIVGLRCRTPEGQTVGTVVEVLRTGSNDVYVVRAPDGRKILLPAVQGIVESVDVAAGEIIVRPPEWTP